MATQMTTSSSFSPGSFGHLYIFYSKQQEREKEKKTLEQGSRHLTPPNLNPAWSPPHQHKNHPIENLVSNPSSDLGCILFFDPKPSTLRRGVM